MSEGTGRGVPVDAASFRSVLGQWPSGVTIVTTRVDGRPHGMTASSFSSVSLDPPLVSVCLSRHLYSHGLIEGSGVFGINILAKDQAHLGKRFAGMEGDVAQRFDGVDVVTAETGAPLIGDALGWLDCRILHAYPGGDHTIFVGEVLAASTPRLTAPLLFHSRAWGHFADLLPDDAHVSDSGVTAALRRAGASPGRVAEVLSGLRDAGVTVRVLDLTGHPPSDLERRAMRADRDAGPGTASALVATAAHVEEAAALGIGVVEVACAVGSDVEAAVVPVLHAARARDLAVAVTVEGVFAGDETEALDTVGAAAALGVDEICLDDAAGDATPLTVRTFLQEAVSRTKPVPLALRPGDRAGLAQANALTALKSGVRRLHGTLGGVDSTAALEDLLYLTGALEVEVGVDRDRVVAAARALEAIMGGPLSARTGALDLPRPARPLVASSTSSSTLGPGGPA